MKFISRSIDRFCEKHRKFGIPRLMMYYVIISAVVYIIGTMDESGTFFYQMLFFPDLVLKGQVWRLVTWVFLPTDERILLFILSLYFYYIIGNMLEREWGTPKLTIFYFSGVLIYIIFGFVMRYVFGIIAFMITTTTFTAYYLNLSMFMAIAVLHPDEYFNLFFVIPLKAKWMAWGTGAIFLYEMVRHIVNGRALLALIPPVALLNFFLICGYDLLSYIRRHKSRVSPRTISFKKESKKAHRAQESATYLRKCAVCGKTDVDSPDMEFRFCSRCNGYHCFCIDHINDHFHFK